MIKIYLSSLLLGLLFVSNPLFAQDISCTERLVLAQTAYDEGKIHEIEKILFIDGQKCLTESGTSFTKEEMTQAYRLLTLSYLQLDEPVKADAMFAKLLETDPEYQINTAIDPIEFINLYSNWRTRAIFKVQGKGGSNVGFYHHLERKNVFDTPREYTYTLGSQFGAGLEFDLSELFTKDPLLKDKWLLNTEFFFTNVRLTPTYSDNPVFESANPQITEYKYGTFDLRLLMSYSILNTTRSKLMATLGVSGNLSIEHSDQLTGGERSGVEGTPMESTDKDQASKYLGYGLGGVAGAQFRYKVGLPWLLAEVRYNYNFIQEVKEGSTWTNYSDIITFGTFVHPKGLLSYLSLNLGVSVPIYKPKKLTK